MRSPDLATGNRTGAVHTSRRLGTGLIVAVLLCVGTPVAAQAAPAKNPVIVVAGMAGPGFAYGPLASRISGDGYRTFIYQLPGLGLGDIHASASAFSGYVDSVLASTRAAKVSLVAHSEGGLVSRDYVKNLGGATKVDKVITLGSPAYGTQLANLATFFTLGTCVGLTACKEMQVGSTYLNALNAGDDSIGTVKYWSFATIYDELVQPYRNAFLNAADGNIVNVTIQDKCWARAMGHVGLIVDGTVYSGVRQALAGSTINLNCWAW